jgi:hypothetical protein
MATGFRALLPFGLSTPATVATVGVRSLLAFWMGGAGVDSGVVPPTPTPTPAGRVKGGIPARRRRRERVYIELDDRTLWFKKEENALAFLRQHARALETRVTAEVERKSRVMVGAREPVALDTSPIEIPRIVVRGSAEAQELVLDIGRRMRAILRLLDAKAYTDLLDEEDEVMLLQ